MADDDLTYEDVIDVWEKEKEAKLPCNLPNNFYGRLRSYIRELESEVEDIEVPAKDKRGRRIQKQYERVQKIAELFFKERQKKIVLAAYHKSMGKTVSAENLVDAEIELLEEISTLLNELKNQVFLGEYKRKPKKGGSKEKERINAQVEEKEASSDEKIEEITEEETKTDSYQVSSESQREKIRDENLVSEEDHLSTEMEGQDEILVHITEDVPSFVDMNVTYDLKKEDVLTLREDLAEVLIERGKARKIKL
ncbi:MAG: hypothetical protein KGY66_07455 [Candidatus Thermoplasmatota archaeon]|nr:hypothetical protein [Candidatus Thermoplasmatota archaeon]MBS3790735.1 hypothetical protein [Candidatus Thermoplasmatota archaeon]